MRNGVVRVVAFVGTNFVQILYKNFDRHLTVRKVPLQQEKENLFLSY